ncbi:hypothetical protein PF002_g17457 [Phytophthora fragariae]|uniref:HTH psq-type domain-containing protein n=1 Tax=Phytophthora fragariae TaxID=53985 RepID=A0A6A3EFY3_9STRA|nr:hypothetical protein PF003_g4975 [Phytophthora fragariae]KAE8932614.1 hypothetical protein PF009_g17361 [Phytophthora fragariae]KAE9215123.1 hypothetical protein PF002_g17457 [Phytophthora fragariae]
MTKVPVETWEAAIAAVAGGLSERKAAKAYGISRGPLHQRINGLVPLEARRAPQLVYITEGADRGVVEMVRYRALHGMCVGCEELRSMLRVAAETAGTRPLTDDFPNDKFTQRWLAKHPDESAPKEKRARDAMNLHDKAGHQTERSKKTLKKWERAAVRRERKAERAAAQRAKAQRTTAQCEQRLYQQEVVERATDGCTLWVDV